MVRERGGPEAGRWRHHQLLQSGLCYKQDVDISKDGSRPGRREPGDGSAHPANEGALSVRESLAVIDAQRDRVRRSVQVDPAVVFSIWAVAWGVGFGAAYLAYGPGRVIPGWLGAAVPAVLMAVGVLTSIGYALTVGRGVSGPSRTAGAMYGWSWLLGFMCLNVINTAIIRRGLAADSAALLWSGSALLLVGVLYLAGGALWNDRVQYGLGVWTLCCAAGAVFVGVPANFLVQAFAGGGGFLALALYYRLVNPPAPRGRP